MDLRQFTHSVSRFFIRFCSTVLLLCVLFQAKAYTMQDSLSVNIQGKNMTIAQVFKTLHQQTGFIIFYNNSILDDQERLDVHFVHANIRDVMDFVTSGKQLSYVIKNRFILLQREDLARPTSLQTSFTQIEAPDITITGTVHDPQGQALPGVTVSLKGTTTGTVTDASGKYSLQVPDGTGTLVFSFIGYTTQEVPINNQAQLNVTLDNSVAALTQVVVTALGITRKEESLTYAVKSVDGDEINKAKEVNVVNALQGKVAGVTITKNANGLGGDSKVLMRGNRSITGNNQPLYIIDGVPLSGSIGMLNTDDIKSMTVLKGASAAALYGSRGQNGAIIITTKSGSAGPMVVNYSGGLTFDQAAVLPELQYEYGQGDGGVYVPNSEHSWGPKADGQMVTLWNGDQVPLKGQPDRLKDFFRTGKTLTNTVSVSGGTDKVQAYFAYGNTRQLGIMRNSDLTRHNVDLKITSNITPKLSLYTKVSYVYEEINNRLVPGEGGTYALPSAYRSPTSIPTNEMKKYSYIDSTGAERQSYWKPGSSILLNPYWALNRVSYYEDHDRIMGIFLAKYAFTDWLSVQVRGSIDKTIGESDNKIWADNYFSLVGSDYNYGTSRSQGTNLDGLISFDRDIAKDLNLSLNAGASVQTGNYKSVSGSANGLYKPNFFFMSNAKSPYVQNSYGEDPLVRSLYATATFSYKGFLYLDATARNDWSSALPKGKQSYFYPSVGLSGIISEMVKLPSWVTYGKARISMANSGYGGTEYLDRNYYEAGAGGQIITPTIQSLGNYKPELTSSFEVGLDWSFFHNRFGFNVTYYDTKTKNQLLLIGAPSASLFNQKYINAGLIRNSGVELVVNFTPIKSTNFTWDATVNFSSNKNKVVRLTPTISSVILVDDRESQIRAVVGGSFGDMYVKDWVKDSLGRRLVDNTGAPILTADRTVFLGNYNPDFMLGFNNTFSYKNVVLSFLIDYRDGGYVIAGTQALIDADGHSKRSLEGREDGLVLDAYTEDGKKNTQSISAQKYWSMIGDRYPTGGLYAYSATNIRLRELTLSYTLPENFLNRTHFIKGATVSLVGRNLFFFKRDAPIDPEITLGINGGGLEYGALPSTRSFGFNLRLTF